MITSTYTVVGMTCGHCVNAVSAEMGRLAGVNNVEVDLDSGAVTVNQRRAARGCRRGGGNRRGRLRAGRQRTPSTMTASTTQPTAPADGEVQLTIRGMTCASYAVRVEKRLNRIDGVAATVNYATEQAKITFPDTVTHDDLIAQVEAVGYTAALPDTRTGREDDSEGAEGIDDDPSRPLRQRLLVSFALAVPVVIMAMIPAAQFRNWQWASLMLAAPVIVWGAPPFHGAAWANLRHRAATMDTLVSMGVLAAFGWSLYALFVGDAACPGCTWLSLSPGGRAPSMTRSTWRLPPG